MASTPSVLNVAPTAPAAPVAPPVPLRPRRPVIAITPVDDLAMPPASPAASVADRLDGPLPADLVRRFDVPGPRYTSYPTADRFTPGFGPEQALQALRTRGADGPDASGPLSLYVHVPFCESVCYYCACNKVITRHHERATEYLDALEREADLVVQALGGRHPVAQLHLGGGTPTFLSDDELQRLVTMLRGRFRLQPDAEVAIEVDPRTVTAARLATLKRLGFNRLSFGVQDFDPAVQVAVHRVQSFESVAALVRESRALGFGSLNLDLIHGLPRQTPASFRRTLEQVVALKPDRIALYGYAHLPGRFKPQRRIHAEDLPTGEQRLAMLDAAVSTFLAHGYAYIGMDHFALHDDPLAVAKREGRLHRNFQGYSTRPDCDLVGLGVSAIGKVGGTHVQNAKTLPEYYEALREGRLPVERGLALDDDDRLRRDVIMALMCQGRVDVAAIERAHGLADFAATFADELGRLAPLAQAGLVVVRPDAIEVTPAGWYVVRAVAMVFDGHLARSGGQEKFSKVI